MQATNEVTAPSALLQMMETRALFEYVGTTMMWPLLSSAPKGDGHTVLVIPGFLADDRSTGVLRRFLRQRGYDAQGWNIGRNLGPRDGVLEALVSRLDQLRDGSGSKVSVVGWSLGGVYAKMLANARPDAVRSIQMLGSPITGNPKATNAWRLYELLSGKRSDDAEHWSKAAHNDEVPATSILTETDGVVAWQNSLQADGPKSENIKVYASHLGLGVNASVLYAIADRLSQPEGSWAPFVPPRLLRAAYPSHIKV